MMHEQENKRGEGLDTSSHHGRCHGTSYINGSHRGRGAATRVENQYLVRHVPINHTDKQIYEILGLGEDGKRTPYNQIPSNVCPVEFTRSTRWKRKSRVFLSEDIQE